MPELPEVETVKRGLEPHIVGKTIVKATLNRDNLRIPFPSGFAGSLEDRKIISVNRRAKYLLITLDNGLLWVVHLGMSGKFTVEDGTKYVQKKHDHVLVLLDNNKQLVFNDARRFGLMTLIKNDELEQHKLLAHYAPEPFSDEFSVEYLTKKLTNRKTPIKTLLMDNKVIVGVGNIYASEVLWRTKIHPESLGNEVVKKSEKLIATIREVLAQAIEAGGSTLKDFTSADGNAGYFQHQFDVYNREGKPCHRCGENIKRITQAGRSSFFCAVCQK